MAYNNYNNRGNNGYKKNYNNNNRYNGNGYNNGFNNGYRPQNDRPVNNGFDARQYKKPDIPITDLNGKTYMISGNFSTAFAANMIKYLEEAKQFENINVNEPEKYAGAFEILKKWCLELINLNIDGIEYTMNDVNAGFNDYFVLIGLINYIAGLMDIKPQETNKPTIK